MKVDSAVLGPSEPIAQFVIRQLLAGLAVRVTVEGKMRDGYIHNLDFAKGGTFVYASVSVPEYEGKGEDSTYARVAIHLDGTVTPLPDR